MGISPCRANLNSSESKTNLMNLPIILWSTIFLWAKFSVNFNSPFKRPKEKKNITILLVILSMSWQGENLDLLHNVLSWFLNLILWYLPAKMITTRKKMSLLVLLCKRRSSESRRKESVFLKNKVIRKDKWSKLPSLFALAVTKLSRNRTSRNFWNSLNFLFATHVLYQKIMLRNIWSIKLRMFLENSQIREWEAIIPWMLWRKKGL